MHLLAISLLVLCVSFTQSLSGMELYRPHHPDQTPWFEGWYTRTVLESNRSVAFILGSYPRQTLSQPDTLFSLIIQSNNSQGLQKYDYHPKMNITNTKTGFIVDFEYGRWKVEADRFQFIASIPSIDLKVNISSKSIKPWGSGLEVSPEGVAALLPLLGLHWYVHSIKSETIVSLTSPFDSIKETGVSHQEKNWGAAFPEKWLWLQAASSNKQLVAVSGKIPVGPVLVPTGLISLRTEKGDWTFSTASLNSVSLQGSVCDGTIKVVASSLLYRLVVEAGAPVNSFTDIFCPTLKGFSSTSVESFVGTANVSLFKRGSLVDRFTLYNVALEFGGDFCTRTTTD